MQRIDQIKILLANNPTDSFLKHALALEYIKVGDDNNAQNTFEALLESDPNYIGSYYHLAKVYERTGATQEAIKIYEQGMEVAKKLEDHHAYAELRSAYEDIIY